jgi:hypothetical protein
VELLDGIGGFRPHLVGDGKHRKYFCVFDQIDRRSSILSGARRRITRPVRRI